MLAARAIQQNNPALFPGLTSNMDGLKDAYLIEGGQMLKYTVTDPKKLGDFVPDGPLITTRASSGRTPRWPASAASGGGDRAAGHSPVCHPGVMQTLHQAVGG